MAVVSDRAVDHGRARGHVFLDDQEIALPLGCRRANVAPGDDVDAGLAAERDLAGQVFKGRRIDRDPESDGEHVAVELGCSRSIDTALDECDAVGAILVGPELASESGECDRIPDSAPRPSMSKRMRLGCPILSDLPRDNDRLAARRAGDVQRRDLAYR